MSRSSVGQSKLCPGAELSAEAVEFGRAVEAWKIRHCNRFPALSDLLHILTDKLGYGRHLPAPSPTPADQRRAEVFCLLQLHLSRREVAERFGVRVS